MDGWADFWHYWLITIVTLGIGMAAVCFIGGIVDLVGFIADLKGEHEKRMMENR